ncbi:ligand-binding sensor domain-containing diguanylate cyclase [Aliidiomarina celeris]|uniref:ligand-binding sensor domain-containing diguanylate cyclase n=1 Tax=Aliidiomarina celeris TaxID=2249428 RepID=UPI000DEB30E4|nr:ligand-binding sensor domain-containing diguanylate cyclase [Aliidiomarina celeris]
MLGRLYSYQTLQRSSGIAAVLAMLTFASALWSPAQADHYQADVPPLSEYFKEVWTTRDDLPHNTVNDIAQTADGYLWFATWEGVARYNGRNFRIFERDTHTQFADSGIHSLSMTTSGQLIAAGARGGVSYQEGEHWYALESLPALVTSVVSSTENEYWISTQGAGVYFIRSQPNGEHQGVRFSIFTEAQADSVFRVRRAGEYGLVAGTANGVFALAPEDMEQPNENSAWQRLPGTEALAGVEVQDLLWAHEHELYLATVNGLFVWQQGVLRGPLHGTDNMRLTRILLDHAGALWLGSQDRGLLRVSRNGLEHYSVAQGLPNNRVVSLFEDRELSVWVGTNSGLVRLRSAPFKSYTQAEGLSDNFVRGLARYSQGGALVATSRGLNRLVNERVLPFLEETELASMSFLSVAEANDGTLWFGTISDGAYAYRSGIVQRLGRSEGLPDNGVRSIEPTQNGDVWFATALGIAVYNGDKLQTFTKEDGLASDFVMVIHEATDGVIWVGTGDGVTQIVKNSDGSYQLKSTNLEHISGAQYVFGFHECPQSGNMWMATDRGLIRYRQTDSLWSGVGRTHGLNQDKFFEIVEDSYGYFWLSSNRGVMRIVKQEAQRAADGEALQLVIERFGESDGMASAQANGGAGPAALLGNEDNVLFATSRGVAVINSAEVERFDVFRPPVVIEHVVVDGERVSLQPHLQLNAGTQRVEFQFAGLGYVMPQRIQYRTKLQGFDSDWIERGTQISAEYTNLAPGDYRFSVEAYYPNAVDRASITHVAFTIESFFWQTKLFWLVIVFCLLLILVFAFRWRLGTLERSEARLRMQVAEKTQELERLAMEDQLTGLPNRRAFDARLRLEFERSQRYSHGLCLAILDVDHFKRINDHWSHETGDRVLIRLGEILQSAGREIDSVARWGGEEFVLLLPETSLENALMVCERLRKAIAQTDCSDIAAGLSLTVSIGVASSQGLSHFEKLLSKADAALYRAKEAGRNQVKS